MWSESVGPYGATVRAYERTPGGTLYLSYPGPDGYVRRSLGHRDREVAVRQAAVVSLEIQSGLVTGRVPTLGELLALYHEHHVSTLAASTQRRREAQRTFWLEALGPSSSALVTREQWTAVARARQAEGLRASSVNRELKYLKAALQWATGYRTDHGRGAVSFLLPANPVRGFKYLRERRPRRPVATLERFEALRACRVGNLPELLDLCMATNRRVSAILSLHWSDVDLEKRPEAHEPFGAILWPARTDKMGEERRAPLTPMGRAALLRLWGADPDRAFPGAPNRKTAHRWLREAEGQCGLEHLEGGAFHPFRRLWATRRKHLSDVDAAEAGGWEDPDVMKLYQQAGADVLYDVMLDPDVERLAMGAR